jgi:tRNA(Ile)-lysidine synthase
MGFAMLSPSYGSGECPLMDDEFAVLMAAVGGFESRPLVAVGTSGGPDSLALMLLANRWARQRGGQAWGLTVDHGLRSESAAEAGTVAGWLAARAIPHEILVWEGEKPTSGIQEAAREARYRLLAEWCREHGCLHLLSAHHREDQAETYMIRRRAGSGVDGLAAMSAVRELPHCRLVRPLLSAPRARLAALLAAEGQPFLRDPSNLDPAYERARLRLSRPLSRTAGEGASGRSPEAGEGLPAEDTLTRLAPDGPSHPLPRCGRGAVDRIIADVRAHGRERILREKALDRLLARAVALHPAGFAVLDPAALAASDAETVERLLDRVAACIGGARYPARRARLARLCEGLAAQPARARTLGGCRFVPWRGRILVLRELAAAGAPARLDPGAGLLWDRRFAVAPPLCPR